MGREATVYKERKCKHCGDTLWATALLLKTHAGLCKRAQEAGLILPRIILEH